ncbi:OmpA family protein, partial [Pasteurellaceae bacterium Phil31]
QTNKQTCLTKLGCQVTTAVFFTLFLASSPAFSASPLYDGVPIAPVQYGWQPDYITDKQLQKLDQQIQAANADQALQHNFAYLKAQCQIELAHWTYREVRTTGITEHLAQSAVHNLQAAQAKQGVALISAPSPGYPRRPFTQWQKLQQLAQQRGTVCAPQALACADAALLGAEYEYREGYGNYQKHGIHFLKQADDYLAQAEQQIASCQTQNNRHPLSADALFRFGRYQTQDLLPQGRVQLQQLAQSLSKSAIEQITVVGHTDRIGSDQANQRLSQRRADTVVKLLRQLLQQQGINTEVIRFVSEGRGESQPQVHCNGNQVTEALKACLQPNRRVEINVISRREG